MLTALLFAGAGVFYVQRTHKKNFENRQIRRDLAHRMSGQRLPKMLQALGIGLSTYLYKAPLKQVDQVIKNCENCEATDKCDEKLKIPELNPEDIDFCPSRDALAQYSRSRRVRN